MSLFSGGDNISFPCHTMSLPLPCHLHSPCRTISSLNAVPFLFPPLHHFPLLAMLFPPTTTPFSLSLPATTHMLAYADNQLSRQQDTFEAATIPGATKSRATHAHTPHPGCRCQGDADNLNHHTNGTKSPHQIAAVETLAGLKRSRSFFSPVQPCMGESALLVLTTMSIHSASAMALLQLDPPFSFTLLSFCLLICHVIVM